MPETNASGRYSMAPAATLATVGERWAERCLGRTTPVTPAQRSPAAQSKASGQHDPAGQPYRSFRGLLEHLATLTRNQVRFTGTRAEVPMLAEPTSAQREAFRLIGVPVPLMLK